MLFAFDLDKTVVTDSHELPPEVVPTLKRLKEQGHEVSVITGRSQIGVSPFPEIISICSYIGLNHGGIILDADGNTIFQSETPQDLVVYSIDNYQAEDSQVVFTTGQPWHVENTSKKRWQYYQSIGYQLKSHDDYRNDIKNGTVLPIDKYGIFKADCTDLLRDIKANYPNLVYYHWEGFGFEALGEGSTKGQALETIAKLHNIPQSETVAFGDGVNDVTMIEWAGTGVAVGKDPYPEVLEASQEHVISAEELGVVKWLEKNILT